MVKKVIIHIPREPIERGEVVIANDAFENLVAGKFKF